MSSERAFFDRVEQVAMDDVLTTTRAVVEAVVVVEFRLATLTALTERFGTRYASRATSELQGAIAALKIAEEKRHAAAQAATVILGASATTLDELIAIVPDPLDSLLIEARAALLVARKRINVLRNKAEDVLGRRIALVVEALASPGNTTAGTYGRDHRPVARLVNGML